MGARDSIPKPAGGRPTGGRQAEPLGDGQLRAAIEHCPDHVLLVDRDRRVVWINRLDGGFQPDDVHGALVETFVPEDSRPQVRTAVERALQSGESSTYEAELHTPEGERRWFLTRVGPVWRDGRVQHAALFATDITEARRSAQRAAQEHAYLGAIETINRAVVASASEEEMVTAALEATLRAFDCDRAFLIAPCDPETATWAVAYQRCREGFATPVNRPYPMSPQMADMMRTCLGQQRSVRRDPECAPLEPTHPVRAFGVQSQLTMAIYPRDSAPWLFGVQHCRSAHVFDQEAPWFENIGARLGDALTATFSRRALRESEERFRALFEEAPEALAILDVDEGHLIDANARCARLYGTASVAELIGRHPLDFSPPLQPDGTPSAEAIAPLLERVLAGETVTFEWMHTDTRGDAIPCEVRLAPFPHPTRRLIRGATTDISARKQAEREREELNEQLVQVQKMQAMGQLTGGVAHDFNNLLTVIVSSLSMIDMCATDPQKVRRFAAHANEAAERAAELTARLLAFAKRQPLKPRPVDLNQLLGSLRELLRRSLGENIDVRLRTAHPLWTCEVDPGQLENALLNLALNARDAMPGGGRLTISTRNANLAGTSADGGPQDFVVVRVSDEGEGMPPEVLRQAFEPFFTTKEVRRGSGLGLSMVYGFVQQSGGQVNVESEVGVGTSVELWLPRSEHTEVGPLPSDAAPQALPHGHGELVLVLEDEPAVRQVTADLLEKLGYRPLTAGQASEAHALLAARPDVKLLLSDVVLGGPETGPQVAQKARRLRPDLPVLLISGYAHDALRGQDAAMAELELLQKPFSLYQLASALERTLRRG